MIRRTKSKSVAMPPGSRLDLLEPAPAQQIEHLALALRVHGVDQGLVAVAQVDAAQRGARVVTARPRAIRQRDRRERTIEMKRHRCWRTGLGATGASSLC